MTESHQIPEFALLLDHVRRLLPVLDAEYEGGTPNRIPGKLMEAYRVALVRARGVPAIDGIMRWGWELLPSEIPMVAHERLAAASRELLNGRTNEAADALLSAERLFIGEMPTPRTLHEAATLAAFSSTLVMAAELFVVRMSCDWAPEPAAVWAFIEEASSGDGSEACLVKVLADALRSEPRDVTPAGVRAAMASGSPARHAGLIMALWAVKSGEVERHRHEIDSRLADLARRDQDVTRMLHALGDAAPC